MKRNILLAILWLLISTLSFSQNPIEIKYDLDPVGSYIVYCNNSDFCTYTVTVDLLGVSNLKANVNLPFQAEVKPGNHKLFDLKPQTLNLPSTFKVHFTYFKGCTNPAVKLDFIYLLPVGKGKETEAFEYEYESFSPKDPEPKDWYAAGFRMKSGDTVNAARRGIVSGMTEATEFQLSDYGIAGDDKFIEIAHDDCSFGRYELLSGTFVRLGQSVEAGDPVGLAGGGKNIQGPQIRFSVHYNSEQRLGGNDDKSIIIRNYWAYVPLIFCTSESKHTRLTKGQRYTGVQPDSVIMQEMNASQIKKWRKNKSHPAPVYLTQTSPAKNAGSNEYAATDRKALQLPDSLTKTTEDIAGYITSNFSSGNEKARAIFIWVAVNIQYDIDNMFALNFHEKKEEKISKSLKTRQGICENYAALFTDICSKSGIKSYVIEGYTKQNGFTDYIPHAWCAAYVDSTWYMFDPTWGSGFVSNGKFYKKINNEEYKANPSTFIKSHMPFDYLWQFLNYPVTNPEFNQGNTYQNKTKPFFNYTDSIRVFDKQDEMEQLISSAGRIERNGKQNSLIFDRLQNIKLDIEHARQSRTINLYNSAVADLNAGINFYNDFIRYKNKQFLPKKPDPEIQDMIDAAANMFRDGKTKLSGLTNPDENTIRMINQLTRSIDDASIQVKEQQDWLKIYLKKGKPERKSMFYDRKLTL